MLLAASTCEHALAAVDRERLALAQRQQPGNGINIAIGQDHGLDRAVARSLRRGPDAALACR